MTTSRSDVAKGIEVDDLATMLEDQRELDGDATSVAQLLVEMYEAENITQARRILIDWTVEWYETDDPRANGWVGDDGRP